MDGKNVSYVLMKVTSIMTNNILPNRVKNTELVNQPTN